MADARLDQHIEKGNEDGLFISCVTSCSNLWALIMDAGTGFTSQVYELSAHFLHKVSPLMHFSTKKFQISIAINVLISLLFFQGMDNGSMGEKLLHNCTCRCK